MDISSKMQNVIEEQLKEIEEKENKYQKLKDNNLSEAENEFWDSDDQVEKQSYYFFRKKQ